MIEYIIALLNWCKVQILLRSKNETVLFKEGEIWWCSIGLNVGIEIYGKGNNFTRPALIFKKLNEHSFLGMPITSQAKEGSWYTPVRYAGRNDRAALAQIRIFDSKRLVKRIGTVGSGNFREIQESFSELYCP